MKVKKLIRTGLAEVSRSLGGIPAVRSWQINREFHVEKALLADSSIEVADQPSVLHYSVNKAATQYTKGIMLRCGKENGLLPVRLSDYAWVKDFPYIFTLPENEVKRYHHLFRQRGFLYTVFGGLVQGVPDLQKYRTLVMVRDPRDLLVSGYYSYSKSHAMPEAPDKAADLLALREKMQNQGIDSYVLEASERTRENMQQYIDLRQSHPSICILKYEDMLADFPTWLDNLLEHCQWQISVSLRDTLIRQSTPQTDKVREDVSNHRRQVTPGNYKAKLQDQTIAQLDEKFAEIFVELGYRP